MSIEFHPGNRLILLNSGREYFPALLAALAAARQEIHLESYIFAHDEVGEAIATALCQAAQRGVMVNVVVDGFGARNFAHDFLPALDAAGVRTLHYRPEIGRFHFKRHRLRRLHRKLVVVDGEIAFVGGINIISDDNAPPEHRPHYDYAVRVEGPVIQDIHRAMRRMWETVSWANLKRRYRLAGIAQPAEGAEYTGPAGQRAAFLVRDNIRHRNDILHAYLDALASARDEVLIANAYFLPGWRFSRALYAAARRGVRITLLLQGKSDHQLLRYATRALYSKALKAGIRIFEYEKSFMHAKVAVIDGEWATVGSSNIDPFSLLLAKESNLVVSDPRFAGELRSSLMSAMAAGAREQDASDIGRISWRTQFLNWLAYGVVRLMADIAGYGHRHWSPRDSGDGEGNTA